MTTSITIDRAGRVLIPKEVRKSLRLSAGDTLQFSSDGEVMQLTPDRPKPRVYKKRGVWVFDADVQEEDVVEAARNARIREVAGL